MDCYEFDANDDFFSFPDLSTVSSKNQNNVEDFEMGRYTDEGIINLPFGYDFVNDIGEIESYNCNLISPIDQNDNENGYNAVPVREEDVILGNEAMYGHNDNEAFTASFSYLQYSNASESCEMKANMQVSSYIKANEEYEARKAISSTVDRLIDVPPLLPPVSLMESHSCEGKKKRKYKYTESSTTESPKSKKQRSCRSINSKYRNGDNLDKNMEIPEEDIERFKELENTLLPCCCCGKYVSIFKVYKVDGIDMWCDKCVKDERVDLIRLKYDIFEDYNYKDEKLYKCERLEHARPLWCFIKHMKKNDSYEIKTNCLFCRNYKSQESHLKNHKRP